MVSARAVPAWADHREVLSSHMERQQRADPCRGQPEEDGEAVGAVPRNAGFVTNALTLSKIVWPSGAEWAASAVGTGAIADQPSQFHILTSLSTRPYTNPPRS